MQTLMPLGEGEEEGEQRRLPWFDCCGVESSNDEPEKLYRLVCMGEEETQLSRLRREGMRRGRSRNVSS